MKRYETKQQKTVNIEKTAWSAFSGSLTKISFTEIYNSKNTGSGFIRSRYFLRYSEDSKSRELCSALN